MPHMTTCLWFDTEAEETADRRSRRLTELFEDQDSGRSRRVMEAMLTMRKIIIADLEAAADAG
ncbi:VOC family protein [Sinomonas notoginsengisoli]|uniref:VOC family protein n=1 Tax=Sinomonas notoginsengisoli TaxID=1457311 RepID=UPI001F1D762F|nr:VOC family protein [Sinomonas notoginsengisoli]